MASKRAVRRRSCESKVSFHSQAEANAALYSLYRTKGYLGSPYRCRFCGKWHIGRSNVRQVKAKLQSKREGKWRG